MPGKPGLAKADRASARNRCRQPDIIRIGPRLAGRMQIIPEQPLPDRDPDRKPKRGFYVEEPNAERRTVGVQRVMDDAAIVQINLER